MLKEKTLIINGMMSQTENISSFRKAAESKEKSLTSENVALKKYIEELESKLRSYEENQDYKRQQQELEELKDMFRKRESILSKEVELRDKELKKKGQVISSMQNQVNSHEVVIKQLKEQIVSLEKTNKHLQHQYNHYKDNYVQWQERALMQLEEHEQFLVIDRQNKQLTKRLTEQLVDIKSKYDRLTLKRTKEVEVPSDGSFPNDQQFLKNLSFNFSKDKGYFRLMGQSLTRALQQDLLQDTLKLKIVDNIRKLEELEQEKKPSAPVELASLQIILPSFAIFLEHNVKNFDFDI